MWKSGFDYTDIVKCDGEFFLVYSTKILLFFPLKISMRYPHFGESAGSGKICSID
jgi:hypothetical protein